MLIDHLLEAGAKVQVHDPEAMDNVRIVYGDEITLCELEMEALAGADALCIMTEWNDYKRPDWDETKRLLRSPVIFDGRNLYEPERMQARGFTYYSVGRPGV